MKNKLSSNSASDYSNRHELSRRDLLRGGAALLGASVIGSGVSDVLAHDVETKAVSHRAAKPNSSKRLITFVFRQEATPRDFLGKAEMRAFVLGTGSSATLKR